VKIKDVSFFIKGIDKGPFSMMRWSDGEYQCMAENGNGNNCNGDYYYLDLKSKLLKAWNEPKDKILYSINPFEKHINKIMDRSSCPFDIKKHKFKKYTDDRDSFNTLNEARNQGELYPFIKKIISKNLVFVGPKFLKDCVIEHQGFIGTGSRNAFRAIETIKNKILKHAESSKESVFFSISAGMCGKVIINELFDLIGNKHYLFDVGSLWDPMCNVLSRTGHFHVEPKNLLKNYPPMKKIPKKGEKVDFFWHDCPTTIGPPSPKPWRGCKCPQSKNGFLR